MKLIIHFILVLLAAQSRSETVQSEESVLEQDRSLRRSSNKNLTIDLLIIIDNSMYTRWLEWSGNDYYACLNKIKPYLASIIDGVNKIYTSLPSYQITFKVVQMYIAKASSQSNYLEDSVAKQYEDKTKRNFEAALPGFSEWVNKHEIGKGKASTERFLKQHDLAIAFTDYSEDHVGGAAGLGVICSNYSQSIVRATDLSLTITATAHEIGHALGSRDDGDGNKCDSGYLMSGASTDKDITNWNKFSTCSIEQIKNKIKALKRSGQNCLDPSKTQREHFEFETSSNLGVHLGADMQCGLRYGRGYKFCSQGLNTGSTMCNKMMCLHMENKTCHGNGTFQTALDGTTCGKGKWCMNGQCVTGAELKLEEKDKKESCYFGDYSSVFLVNFKLTECKDFFENPSFCYTSQLEAFCCDTCEQIKLELSRKRSIHNCTYGDRRMVIYYGVKLYGCELVFQETRLCNKEPYITGCCESCDQVKKGQTVAPPTTKTELPDEISTPNCPYENKDRKIISDVKTHGCELVFTATHLCDIESYQRDCCLICEQVKKRKTAASLPTKIELPDDAQVKWTYSTSSDQDSQPSLPEQKTGKGDITDIANAIVEMDPKSETNTAEKERDLEQDRSLRRRRSSKKNLIMDLLVIIDNSMYTRWLKWSGHNSYTCFNKIKHYLASIIDGVNNIYSSLPSYQITFKVVQIYLSEASSQSNYLEDSVGKQYEDKAKRNFTAALPGFSEWVNKHEIGKGESNTDKFLKQHDLAIAFTDYSEDPVGGAAGLGVICSDYSQSIVQATDLNLTITTTAHEIGHALGSRDDGDGNQCDSSYLMSKASTDKDITIWKKLSTCSIEQIENKIKALESAGQNCMDPSKTQIEHLELDEFLSSNLGVHLGADMQCGLRYGSGYKFCSQGLNTNLTMCNDITCLHVENKTCHGNGTFHTALDGTTCGKRKWCMHGQCVTGAQIKPEEKDKKESCYFGDYSSALVVNFKQTECKDFFENPSFCYTSQLEAFCCDTCEKIKLHLSRKRSIHNCTYGDRRMVIYYGVKLYGCDLVFQETRLCNKEPYIRGCCESCDQVKKGQTVAPPTTKTELPDEISIPNCPYGHKDKKIFSDGKTYGCELVFTATHLCDIESYQRDCCLICEQVKKRKTAASLPTKIELSDESCIDKIGETYNEEQIDCNTLLQNPEKCNSVHEICCKTCSEIKME